MNRMVNNIQLVWKLACMFKIYRTCNPMIKFSKYKFINKLLGGVTLFINLFYLFILYIDYKIIDIVILVF